MRGRAKRALRTNRDFYCSTPLVGRGHAVARQVAPADLVRLLEDPEPGPARKPANCWLRARRPAPPKEAELPVAGELAGGGRYECWRQRGWWHSLLGPVGRRPRARRRWHHGHALLEPRHRHRPGRWLLVFRGVLPAKPRVSSAASRWTRRCTLEQLLWTASERPDGQRAPAHARRLARRWVPLLGRLHAWRIVLDDLSPADLLVVGQAENAEVWVLNTLAVRFVRKLSPAEQLRQLARLLHDIGGCRADVCSQCRALLCKNTAASSAKAGRRNGCGGSR